MEKRKLKNQGRNVETKKKKQKMKSKEHTVDADSDVQEMEVTKTNRDGNKAHKSPKHIGELYGKKRREPNRKDEFGKKASSVQNLLTEKLKKAQTKRTGNVDEVKTDKVAEAIDKVEKVSDINKSDTADLQNETVGKVKNKSNKKKKDKTDTDSIAGAVEKNKVDSALEDSHGGEDEEEDPEKAAIREKKREKRKQKKLEKEKIKQQNKDRAGTAVTAAVDYLNQWKNNKDEWKFLKVRQVWLLQNMYDQTLIDERNFETLLEYLEGLRGKSREVTVSEAEKIVEKSEEEESSSVKFDRARHIIQLLSD